MSTPSTRSRRVVGVVIDGDVLRGVELRRGLRGLRALAAAEVVLPNGGRGEDFGLDPESIAEGLRALWAEGGFRSRDVAFGVNGRDATIRPMTVPNAALDDLDGYVRYELAEYLSYELDDAVIDHQVVGSSGIGSGGNGSASTGSNSDDDASLEVLAIGVRTALLDTIADAIDTAGLTLVSVDAAPTALAVGIGQVADDTDGDAVVSVDGTRTTVVLRSGGRPRMVRVLAEGGGSHSTQLAEELDSLIARVDEHRRGGHHQAGDAQDQRFSEAADAVAAAINYDLREHTGTGVAHVILTGAFGRFDSLHHLMTGASGAPVTSAVPPQWWPATDDEQLGEFDQFAEPAGLAYTALAATDSRFDLMPPAVVEQRRNRVELGVGIAAAAAIVAGGIVALGPYRERAAEASVEAEALEGHVATLSMRVDSLAIVADLEAARVDINRGVDTALADDLWWSRILVEIGAATPDDTFLTSVTLERPLGDEESVTDFTGISTDQASVGEWLAAMEALPIFADVWLVQSSATVVGEDELAVVSFLAKARLTEAARAPRAVDPASVFETPPFQPAVSVPAIVPGGTS